MDKDLWAVVVLMVIVFFVGIAFGYSGTLYFRYEPLQATAVERGYAEWVVPDAGRGEAVFQWVDTTP